MDEQPMVVTAPILFTATKVKHVGGQLRAALARRPVAIADLTRTWACDVAAIAELGMAHEQARAVERELRIVISSASILRQFVLAGLDAQPLIYPSLNLASRPGRATSVGPGGPPRQGARADGQAAL